MNVSLKQAADSDFPLISEMAHRIWGHHYVPIIGKEQVAYMLNKMYTTGAILKQVDEGQSFYLILSHHTPVGYMAVSHNEAHEYMLHKFYIEVAHQGKDIGKQAYLALLPYLPDAKKISLTVNRQNYKSINFYFKLGFYIESVADFDIGNGYYMNDFVMCKDI